MPNAYLSLSELKALAPDSMRASTTKYDAAMLRLAAEVSRWIDNYCKRHFYPVYSAIRYYNGENTPELWIPDLVSLTSLAISEDGGITYTTLTPGDDYLLTCAGDENGWKSYSQLVVNPNSSALAVWPDMFRAVRISGGVWAYADDRSACWESTGDTVQNNPLTAGGTSLIVADVDGPDAFAQLARFQVGALYRIESEFVETTGQIDTSANTVPIVRARNGSAAASHAQNTAIDVWRPPEPVKQAAAIQAMRQLERGFSGFGDARATAEVGQLFFMKSLDPEAQAKLSEYVNHQAWYAH